MDSWRRGKKTRWEVNRGQSDEEREEKVATCTHGLQDDQVGKPLPKLPPRCAERS